MNIYVTKPHGSGYWQVGVEPSTTAQECIDSFVTQGKVPSGDYRLYYQGQELHSDDAFENVGVQDECTVAMQQLQQGARVGSWTLWRRITQPSIRSI